jgi:hypothetical protein
VLLEAFREAVQDDPMISSRGCHSLRTLMAPDWRRVRFRTLRMMRSRWSVSS